jgi:hypothetical protein
VSNTINWDSSYVRSCLHEESERYGEGDYCVYFWQDRWGDVFYVGSGKGYRFNQATDKCRSAEFMDWFNRGDCCPKIVWYGLSKEQSIKLERRLIKTYWKLGFPLVNKDGIKEREIEYRARAERTKIERGIRPYMHILHTA